MGTIVVPYINSKKLAMEMENVNTGNHHWEEAAAKGGIKNIENPKPGRFKVVKPPAPAFECRVCGCGTYSSKNKSNGVSGPGNHSSTMFYYCDGCSVAFIDLEKFSIAKTKV